jgi:hypothetical protein
VSLPVADILGDFREQATIHQIPGWPCSLEVESCPAPHRPSALRLGHGAVYVFALSTKIAATAGPGRILKVGRVGPNSNARFQSQHYNTASTGSSLAKSLIGYPLLWPWLGVSHLDAATVREWMMANLDRLNIYVPASSAIVLPSLEMYVRARLGGSVYEGSA